MNIKKIAIITLFGNYNFGNRLQNFAVQRLLENKGYYCETIDFNSKGIKRSIHEFIKESGIIFKNYKSKRCHVFKKFNKKYLHVRKIRTPNGIMPCCIKNQYQYFVVGSDQVWNPELRKGERQIMFLRFADPEQRICISPSLGVTEVEKIYEDELKYNLEGFRYLSCREDSGSDEINRITGKICETLIDPTLAIEADDWFEFSNPGVVPSEKYLLLFFLGELTEEIIKTAETFAKQEGLIVVDPSNLKSTYYYSSPNDFVALIDNATFVMTDSFHVTAFSINLETPFYVFDRKSKDPVNCKMSSRIISLTRKMGLEDRYCTTARVIDKYCDFTISRSVLKLEREKMNAYLDKVLDIE